MSHHDTTPAITDAEADMLALWRALPATSQRIVFRLTSTLAAPGADASASATVRDLFAEWWRLDQHTVPATDAEDAANNDRMRDLAARMIATPPTSPADLAMAVIADTYHGSFGLDDGNGLRSLCYALAGVPVPAWCQSAAEGDDDGAEGTA